MVISMVQNSPQKGALLKNLKVLDTLLSNAAEGSLVFLPELFSTSYVLQPEDLGGDDYKITEQWMFEKARDKNCFIGGSVPFPAGDKMYNRWLGTDQGQQIHHYDKVHLFLPGGEGKGYVAGNEVKQFLIKERVVRPLICYDLRFPYLSFQDTACLYDVLVYAANWPSPRIEQWKQLLKARAIENQCYVVGVNRVGEDHNGNAYPGSSMVVDFTGKVMTEMDDKESMASVELDLSGMYQYRERHPFLRDSRPEAYQMLSKICRQE